MPLDQALLWIMYGGLSCIVLLLIVAGYEHFNGPKGGHRG